MHDDGRQNALFAAATPAFEGNAFLMSIWQEFLKIVHEEEGSRIVETWFKAVSFVRWDSHAHKVYLQAPNKFVKEWIERNYVTIIKSHLSRLLSSSEILVCFDEDGIAETSSAVVQGGSSFQSKPLVVRPSTEIVAVRQVKKVAALNQNYTFESFVTGSSNSFAASAALAVAQKVGKFCNPFFMYGSSGLGKTHLLHAIGNYVKEHNKKATVLYQPASRFVNEFINAIRSDKVGQFEAKFKELDLLLIDDIQSISNKEQTQEAFFHIFNVLYDNHKQIVFSSDTYPKDMNGIEERLRSRFEWGLVADIQAPKLETKMAILQKKAEVAHCQLSDDVAEYMAFRATNVRVLEGSLVRVLAFASLTHQPLTLELVQKVLEQDHKEPETVTLEAVAREVCKYYHLSLADLRSSCRRKDLVLPRQVAMYLMKEYCDKSLNDVSIFLKRKNHSTVLHALDKIQELMKINVKLSRDIDAIKKKFV